MVSWGSSPLAGCGRYYCIRTAKRKPLRGYGPFQLHCPDSDRK